MPQTPLDVTREHVLAAVNEIEEARIKLQPSTLWDVIINGKAYPPKDMMRYAHKQKNGKIVSGDSASPLTTTYLDLLGFLIRAKNERADNIKSVIQKYKDSMDVSEFSNKDEKWYFIQRFHNAVDPSNPSFAENFGSIRFANFTYRMAPAVIKELLNDDPVRYQQCLAELFDEEYSLHERISTFIREVEAHYRQIHPEHGNSSHHDERTIATLLTLRYPNRYTFFMDTFYRNFCSLMGVSPRTDKGEKYVHYLKYIYEFTSQYVITDQELLALADRHIPQDAYPDVDRLILAQDIIFRMLGKDSLVGRDNLDHINIVEEDMKTTRPEVHLTKQFKPQNLILYGPPGTGKTYHSVNKALEIVDPGFMKAPRDRTQITKRYRELVDEGRIVFTTFHQSMSYEDFIEGIKPITNEDRENSISYEVVPGIFKRLCDLATAHMNMDGSSGYSGKPWDMTDLNEESPKIVADIEQTPKLTEEKEWAQSLSREDLFLKSYDRLLQEVERSIKIHGKHEFATKQGAVHSAIRITDDREIKIKRENAQKSPYIVRIPILRKIFVETSDIDDLSVDKVGNLVKDMEGGSQNHPTFWAITKRLLEISRTLNPIKEYASDEKIDEANLDSEYKSSQTEPPIWGHDNYVLIIDEINRGNVSQIFGELITLIEPDKRVGMPEALEVTLPYSKEKFSVPANLHIIGTMNTADRSVEALDTALRRRFSFCEMSPDYSLLNGHEVQGIDLGALLKTINQRIDGLLDKDHAIGHSYFLKVIKGECTLRDVFFDEIIPLLQEYFYGNFGRIELVLGRGFVRSVPFTQSVFAAPSPDNDEFGDHIRYTLIPRREMDDPAFAKALQVLMKYQQ